LNHLDSKERFDRVNEARKTLATIVGGIFLLAGLFGTWQNLKVAQEGQITERFTKAIDQLGATSPDGKKEKLEVRLGGIYALERIGIDSRKDHWTIIEILSTYVRENSPVNMHDLLKSEGIPEASKGLPEATLGQHVGPRIDIQAILTILGKPDQSDEASTGTDGTHTRRLNLSGAALSGAMLENAHFSRAWLFNTDLREADLRHADLARSALYRANLSRALLDSVDLSHANLQKAMLVSTVFDLRAFPVEIDLSASRDGETDLRDANFRAANLSQAYFGNAKLDRANFNEANLTEANVSGTDLRLVQNLTQEQIEKAVGDSSTKLPANLHMPEAWKK
jgi:hypothetical protein